MLAEKYVELKLTKYRLYLTEQELTRLLAKDPDKWAEWIKRGKGFTRAAKARQQMAAKREREAIN